MESTRTIFPEGGYVNGKDEWGTLYSVNQLGAGDSRAHSTQPQNAGSSNPSGNSRDRG